MTETLDTRFPDENPLPVCRVSVQGVVVYANAGFRELLASWTEDGSLPAHVAENVRQAAAAGQVTQHVWDVDDRVFRGWITPVAGKQYVNVYAYDDTERAEAMKALEAARDAAQAASDAKSTFVATMSHEFRTPLNAIIGMTELAIDEAPADLLQYLTVVRDSGESLLDLISGVLDVARIEAGKIEVDEVQFSLDSLVADVVGVFRLRAQHAGLRLSLLARQPVGLVIGDPGRTRQIIMNLVANAVKYTRRGSIEVSCERLATGRVQLAVEDTGIGIRPEDQGIIFDKFVQLARPSNAVGTGLGLHIIQAIVLAMDGDMDVHSALGVGSRFTVSLPLPSAKARAGRRTTLSGVPASVQRPLPPILLVEDNVDNAVVARRRLERSGHRVHHVATAPAAVEAALEPHCLILMDIHLGEQSGLDAARQIRAAEERRGASRVPIIALTAHATDAIRRECYAVGMNDFLTKPIRGEHLLDTVNRWAHGRHVVLVVDDAADSRRLIGHWLRKESELQVVESPSAEAGLERMERGDVALAFVDLNMTGMSGLQMVRHIRRQSVHSRVVLVAVTGEEGADVRRRCLDAGFDAFLTKPVRRAQLMEQIDAHLVGAMLPFDEMPTDQNVVGIDADLMPLIPPFLEDRRQDARALRTAVSQGDWGLVGRLGHSMKGTGASYGFHIVSDIGRVLQRAAESRSASETIAAVSALEDLLATVEVVAIPAHVIGTPVA